METNPEQNAANMTEIYNLIILDESGSMEDIRNQTISGFNEVIQTIVESQKLYSEQLNYITFVTFNTLGIKTRLNHTSSSDLREITVNDYSPISGTPLLDAVGFSCARLRNFLKDKTNYKVIVTILTDGYENASREYSVTMIRSMIQELRAEGWVFTFIGSEIDVDSVADNLSINNKMAFLKEDADMKRMFEKEKLSRMNYYKKIRNKLEDLDNYYDDKEDENKGKD